MDGLRFYVDESLLGLGKTLSYARRDVTYPGHRRFRQVGLGALDTEWIPIVAAAGLIAIIRDRHVFTRWWESDLIVSHRLRVIHLAVKRDLTNWGYLTLLVERWEEIEREVGRDIAGPWRLAVYKTKVELTAVEPKPHA